MSGPKNHRVRLSAARRQAEHIRREAANAARRRATKERMRASRQRAALQAAELARRRAEVVRHRAEEALEIRARATRDDLERRRRSVRDVAVNGEQDDDQSSNTRKDEDASSKPPTSHTPPADIQEAASTSTSQAIRVVSSDATDQLRERLLELSAWRDALGADEAVQQFHRKAADAWRAAADACLAEDASTATFTETLDSLENMCREAQRLHDEAGTNQAEFAARNDLLRDVMDSLKEIGFFVGDPTYAIADDPAGPVLLKATRGPEMMTASIDLSQAVHSVWDGQEDEHCKATFFEYVERMKARGVDVDAERSDLQEPPRLKQQGAKELPRGQQFGGGA